jgi:hypothetical protein
MDEKTASGLPAPGPRITVQDSASFGTPEAPAPERITLRQLVRFLTLKKVMAINTRGRTNPHSFKTNRGKKQPAGAKIAKLAKKHEIGVCRVR